MALAQALTSKQPVLYLDRRGRASNAHPAVRRGIDRMRAANEAWNKVDAQQFQAWKRYAETIRLTHPKTGAAYHPTAKNAFVSLAIKLLQVDPSAEVPLDPPRLSFSGDCIELWVCEASSDFFGCGPSGALCLCASAPNQPNVITEVLVQRLKNCRRSPTQQYRSVGFVQFGPEGLCHEIPLEPGLYSLAYRFVERTTGQMAPKVVLGTYEVA